MVEAFAKLRASTMLGGVTYKDYAESMLDMPSKAWVGPLTKLLEPEIVRPAKDKSAIDPFRDQQFWQATAAQLAGQNRRPGRGRAADEGHARSEQGRHSARRRFPALVKLGKPTVDAATEAATRQRRQAGRLRHAPYQRDHGQRRRGHALRRDRRASARYVGSRRSDGAGGRLGTEKDAATRAVIARELSKVPATEESKAAFKTAFESFTLESEIPPGGSALEALTEAAGQFYDPGHGRLAARARRQDQG